MKIIRQIIIVIGLLAICAALYLAVQINRLSIKLKATESELASTTVTSKSDIQQLEEKLARANQEKTNLTNVLNDAQRKTVSLENDKLANEKEISDLTKLTTLDPELLKKYSKVYFLSENYVPTGLRGVNTEYLIDTTKVTQVLSRVYPFLVNMLEDAHRDNVPILILSAYRSFETQKSLKQIYVQTFGAGTANQFSAEQGYSEHQLGTALDFTTPKIKGAELEFQNSSSFNWLRDNAYKYGFIISYPKENTYYQYEPWHWRFVGVALATYLHNQHKYFYELDQKQIDEYLIKIFDSQ